MSLVKEKVAYVKGLAEGMHINENSNEGKLLMAILEVLDDVALSIEEIEEAQSELSDQVCDIDEDLAEIEKIVFEEDYEAEMIKDSSSLDSVECPHCGTKFDVDEDMIDDENDFIQCPKCNKEIDIEWECSCEDCDEDE